MGEGGLSQMGESVRWLAGLSLTRALRRAREDRHAGRQTDRVADLGGYRANCWKSWNCWKAEHLCCTSYFGRSSLPSQNGLLEWMRVKAVMELWPESTGLDLSIFSGSEQGASHVRDTRAARG